VVPLRNGKQSPGISAAAQKAHFGLPFISKKTQRATAPRASTSQNGPSNKQPER
jgi:hypothetical protein